MTAIHVTGPHDIGGVTRYKVAIRDGDGIVIERGVPQFWMLATPIAAYGKAERVAQERKLEVVDEVKRLMP